MGFNSTFKGLRTQNIPSQWTVAKY